MVIIDNSYMQGAYSTNLDMAVEGICAAMLWPSDDTKRLQMLWARFCARQLNADMPGEVETNGPFEKQVRRGYAAAFIAHSAIGLSKAGKTFKISNFKDDIASLKSWNLSVKTIDNDVWKKYRSVSPLWAAHLIISQQAWQGVIPCIKENLCMFLSLAQVIRDDAHSIRTPRSSEPSFLRKCDDYQISKRLSDVLPHLALDFTVEWFPTDRPNR